MKIFALIVLARTRGKLFFHAFQTKALCMNLENVDNMKQCIIYVNDILGVFSLADTTSMPNKLDTKNEHLQINLNLPSIGQQCLGP